MGFVMSQDRRFTSFRNNDIDAEIVGGKHARKRVFSSSYIPLWLSDDDMFLLY
jgi:hypothetical protein